MRVLSVRQPFASLIVSGEKRCENREWKALSKIKGEWIAIHASAKPEEGEDVTGLPLGAIIGAAYLDHCCWLKDVPKKWRRHHHTNGPCCLLFAGHLEIVPVKCKGKLGFWNCPQDVETTIREGIELCGKS